MCCNKERKNAKKGRREIESRAAKAKHSTELLEVEKLKDGSHGSGNANEGGFLSPFVTRKGNCRAAESKRAPPCLPPSCNYLMGMFVATASHAQ